MAVVVRLARQGRLHRPYFRVVAMDRQFRRDGRAAEVLGTYDPLLSDKNLTLDLEALHRWVNNGAQVSDALVALCRRFGYDPIPASHKESAVRKQVRRKARRKAAAKSDGKTWTPPSRRALKKHEAVKKAERLATQAAEAAAKAQAKAAAEAEAPAETPAADA